MIDLLRTLSRIALSTALVGLTGCAVSHGYEFSKPIPPQSKPLLVSMSGEDLSAWSDLPIGAYRIPDSQVVVSGHQKGGLGILFGVIGVAVVHAANAVSGEQATKQAETALRMKVTPVTEKIAAELIASGRFGDKLTLAEGPQDPVLSISSALVMTFVSETDVRPYVMLKTSLLGPDRKPVWTTRYTASTGVAKPLIGDGSWSENGGEPLKQAVAVNVRKALARLFADISAPYPRDPDNLYMVQGPFPYARQRMQFVGYRLTEESDTLTFVPILWDSQIFAGVHVMDKSMTVARPATKEDRSGNFLDTPAK